MNWFDVVVISLAAWRVSYFVTNEAGPGGIMTWIRERFGVGHNEFGEVDVRPLSGWGKLLSCVWCFSFWAAVGMIGLWHANTTLVFVFAVWGCVGVIEGLVFRAS